MRIKSGRARWISIKIDLEKAYDRVKLSFVGETLTLVDFLANLIKIIMDFITTASMGVLWNRKRTNTFQPSRSL